MTKVGEVGVTKDARKSERRRTRREVGGGPSRNEKSGVGSRIRDVNNEDDLGICLVRFLAKKRKEKSVAAERRGEGRLETEKVKKNIQNEGF